MEMKDDSDVSVHTSKPDEAESADVTSSNDVVFQCSQCDAIVGDSTSWVSSNKIMRTLTLGRVTSKVGVKSDIEISESGIDMCSTFHLVYCISCNEVLGNQYVASPPELDYIRGYFTLQVEKLNSYEVGSAQTSGSSDLADIVNVPSPGYMLARMNKMQFLIVSMNDRIKNLETCLGGEATALKQANTEHGDGRSLNQGDVESVSSSENLSLKACTYTDHAEDSYRPNVDTMLIARRTSENNLGYDSIIDRQTQEIKRNTGVLPNEPVIRKGSRKNIEDCRQVNPRTVENKDISIDDGSYVGLENEDAEKLRKNVQRSSGKKIRNGMTELDKNAGGRQNCSEQSNARGSALHGITEAILSPSKRSANEQMRSPVEMVNEGFMSPSRKVNRGLSHNMPHMETWPSPVIDRRGRDNKKRKFSPANDN